MWICPCSPNHKIDDFYVCGKCLSHRPTPDLSEEKGEQEQEGVGDETK
jgi:hypothetical protein